eukprot:6821252-Pyramimonas_sp.AAC.1
MAPRRPKGPQRRPRRDLRGPPKGPRDAPNIVLALSGVRRSKTAKEEPRSPQDGPNQAGSKRGPRGGTRSESSSPRA